jgi:uncharacterized membrane protein YcaP (DUF421 family)
MIYLKIILCTIVIYFFMIIALRLFGKKELSQITIYDLVFILLISNAVQNAMVVGDNSLLGGVLAALTLFVVSWIFNYAKYRSPAFDKLIEGDAIILVANGKIIPQHMEKCKMTDKELMEIIREHGFSNLKDVNTVIFEVDGNMSVISKTHQISKRKKKAHKIVSKVE